MATGSLPDPNKPPRDTAPEPEARSTQTKPAPAKFAPKGKKK